MTIPSHQIAAAVELRARSRCEYCRMHQSLQGATFHVEHIFPSSKGGASTLENLAWCCPSCNLHKSDRIDSMDPQSSETVPLFHPRQSIWSAHFKWVGYQLVGQTPVGRATIAVLNLNSPRRLLIRRAEERFSLFPPS
jgi:hypothetical protein